MSTEAAPDTSPAEDDVLTRLTDQYARAILGEPLADESPVGQLCCEQLDVVLAFHQKQFRDAGKPADRDTVVESLQNGEFAFGRRAGCDLLADFFLARFYGQKLEAAARHFITRFEKPIRGWARRFGPNDNELADSILGDLLLPRVRVGPRIDSYRAEAPLDSWLRQVVYSQAQRRYRERSRMVEAGAGGGDLTEQVSDGVGGEACPLPDERYVEQDCTNQLAPLFRRAMSVLGERERTVLMLAVVDGVPQNRVARLLQVPEYTISRLKTRAIERVHQQFYRIARQIEGMDNESIRGCLELILKAFPGTELGLIPEGGEESEAPDAGPEDETPT